MSEHDADALALAYRVKAEAELASADESVTGGSVTWSGDPIARVALVKGQPGPADTEAGRALAGEDGVAAGKALEALGYSTAFFAMCSAPTPGLADEARAFRVRLAMEAVDPAVVIALDSAAATDLGGAFGIGALTSGEVTHVPGRVLLALDGFADSLGDTTRKRRVWEHLRLLEPELRRLAGADD